MPSDMAAFRAVLAVFLDIACLASLTPCWVCISGSLSSFYCCQRSYMKFSLCVCDTGNSCRLDYWNPLRKWS